MKFSVSIPRLLIFIFTITYFNCKNETKVDSNEPKKEDSNTEKANKILKEKPSDVKTPEGMVWVSGKTFIQGAKEEDKFAMMREKPAHQVTVDGFFMDINEVTNKEFKAFVSDTDYITVAERPIDWEDMKKELPPNTQKPHDSIFATRQSNL